MAGPRIALRRRRRGTSEPSSPTAPRRRRGRCGGTADRPASAAASALLLRRGDRSEIRSRDQAYHPRACAASGSPTVRMTPATGSKIGEYNVPASRTRPVTWNTSCSPTPTLSQLSFRLALDRRPRGGRDHGLPPALVLHPVVHRRQHHLERSRRSRPASAVGTVESRQPSGSVK